MPTGVYTRSKEQRLKISNTLKRKGIKPPSRTGSHITEEHRKKLIDFHTGRWVAEKHPSWKGDNVGISGLHEWIKKQLIKPETCQDCGKKKKLDLANISQDYKRELSDWEWLCRKCHMTKDRRIENIKKNIHVYSLKSKIKNTNKSGYKGVHWHKSAKKWIVQFRGKSLGFFTDVKEAGEAYQKALNKFLIELEKNE